jgi:hypothetical protein
MLLLSVKMQNLIIYKFYSLYQIFDELKLNLNFKINFVDNKDYLNKIILDFDNYLILSNQKYPEFFNQFHLNNLPINISKLLEIINIEFLKLKFHSQSEVKINHYTINMNSREILADKLKLKLTEKEIDTIIYLSKSQNPVSIRELQEKVWQYHNIIDTHTVETHIYRLRKKFLKTFNDVEFIVSKKNGYEIK